LPILPFLGFLSREIVGRAVLSLKDAGVPSPHVAFADAVAVGVAGQLAGGVDDLAAGSRGAILHPKLPGIWRMSVQTD
jgi:hypothetical protein